MLAARLGRDRARRLRRDWESVKVEVMRKAVMAKFEQHEDLCALLLSTRDAKIVEHTENDAYWGDGGDGSGKNMLAACGETVDGDAATTPSANHATRQPRAA
jgi:ribA/ribD-fused uncharacterized protein